MIIKITDKNGNVAYINNDGEKLGEVAITGDSPLVAALDLNLNQQVDIFWKQREKVLERLPKEAIIFHKGRPIKINQASNVYLKEYFIPVVCPALGWQAEIIED